MANPSSKLALGEPDSFIRSILDHDRLMTPTLQGMFGEIVARQTDGVETDTTYTRISAIFTHPGNRRLLDARLEIDKSLVPDDLVEALRTTATPFGQLLRDFEIEAQSAERVLFKTLDRNTERERWGRRHSIVAQATGKRLCRIEELLLPEEDLPPVI